MPFSFQLGPWYMRVLMWILFSPFKKKKIIIAVPSRIPLHPLNLPAADLSPMAYFFPAFIYQETSLQNPKRYKDHFPSRDSPGAASKSFPKGLDVEQAIRGILQNEPLRDAF